MSIKQANEWAVQANEQTSEHASKWSGFLVVVNHSALSRLCDGPRLGLDCFASSDPTFTILSFYNPKMAKSLSSRPISHAVTIATTATLTTATTAVATITIGITTFVRAFYQHSFFLPLPIPVDASTELYSFVISFVSTLFVWINDICIKQVSLILKSVFYSQETFISWAAFIGLNFIVLSFAPVLNYSFHF